MRIIEILVSLFALMLPSFGQGGSTVPDVPGSTTTLVSGSVFNTQSQPMQGIQVSISGGSISPSTKTTVSDGTYFFNNIPKGANYTLTPSAPGMTFSPSSFTISNLSQPFSANFFLNASSSNLASNLQFVPVTPCRIADTRNPSGPFGAPSLYSGSSRDFNVPSSSCGIPSNAQAYALNVTVVPTGPLNGLQVWPTGQSQPPNVWLLKSDGRTKAVAAIVPAGANGSISFLSLNSVDLILDINGYFIPSYSGYNQVFYPVTPCRVSDTRNGGGAIQGGQSRDFSVVYSSCGIPFSAQAYSLNVTAIPQAGGLSFLTMWPTGQSQPFVSTLNAPTGTTTANAAIIPAGSNGSVSVYVYQTSDVLIDINGYFGPPGSSGALTYNTVNPCQLADTYVSGGGTASFPVPSLSCGISTNARAYSVNALVVPSGGLSFLTLWPSDQGQPFVSTLNAGDGSTVSNAALVPAAQNGTGSISAYAYNSTELVLSIYGYFAP